MTPGRRYKLFFFFSFSFLAYFLAFLPIFWEHLGFSVREIAVASMMGTVATIVSAPFVLSLAYNSFAASRLLTPLILLGLLGFFPYLFVTEISILIPAWFIAAFAGKGIYALIEAQAIRDGSERDPGFEEVRIWGSYGFIIATMVLGQLVDFMGVAYLGLIGMAFMLASYSGALVCKPLLGKTVRRVESSGEIKSLGSYRGTAVALYVINLLLWASHTPLYVYLSVHLRSLDWTGGMISTAWTIGVICEIGLFLIFPWVEKRFRLVTILRSAILFAFVRWSIMANQTGVEWILLGQFLHLFTFGACYLASVKIILGIFPESLKDKGQGYLTAIGVGLGSFLGRVAAMAMAENYSIPEMFNVASYVAILALPFSFLIKDVKRGREGAKPIVAVTP